METPDAGRPHPEPSLPPWAGRKRQAEAGRKERPEGTRILQGHGQQARGAVPGPAQVQGLPTGHHHRDPQHTYVLFPGAGAAASAHTAPPRVTGAPEAWGNRPLTLPQNRAPRAPGRQRNGHPRPPPTSPRARTGHFLPSLSGREPGVGGRGQQGLAGRFQNNLCPAGGETESRRGGGGGCAPAPGAACTPTCEPQCRPHTHL